MNNPVTAPSSEGVVDVSWHVRPYLTMRSFPPQVFGMDQCVQVVVDRAPARLGALSYLVEGDVKVGDAVEVPFGKRIANAVVVGMSGDRTKATKHVTKVWGSRIDPADIQAAETIAVRHFTTLEALAARFAPRQHKDASPTDAGAVKLGSTAVHVEEAANKYLLRSPSVSPVELAASAATQLHHETAQQILVICPSKQLVSHIVQQFHSGAAALDQPGGWSGFRAGTVHIGVTTRTGALWSPHTLGGIVVVEEDHIGHIEAKTPHTNARDVAILRARFRQVPLCLTGTTPSGAGLGADVKVVDVGEFPSVAFIASDRQVPSRLIAQASLDARAGKTVAVVAPSRSVSRRCVRCHDVRPCAATGCTDARCEHPVTGQCRRCGERKSELFGFDAERVASMVPDGVDVITPGDLPKGRYDSMFVCDAGWALRRPGFEPERSLIEVICRYGSHLTADGTATFAVADDNHPVCVAAASGDHVLLAKMIWKRCSDDSLAPFGVVVKLDVGASAPPVVSAWPGEVLGPISTAPKQWELLVKLNPGEMARFGSHLDRLRTHSKVRFSLL